MLSVKCLNVFYGDAQALWDVSFEVPEKKLVTIIGSNGAGKSTLLKAISNLLVSRSGEIQIQGHVTTGLAAHHVAELGVAHVPEGRQLFPLMTVMENLRIGSVLPEAKAKREETLREVFDLFPVLGERQSQMANTLSGGEQQMLAIGRGLMSIPKCIMFDEPSLGIAPNLVEQILAVVQQIAHEGITVILVEQEVKKALKISARGYVIESGRLVMRGKSQELLADPDFQRAYLGL